MHRHCALVFSFQSLNFEQSSGNLSRWHPLASLVAGVIITACDGTIFRKSTKKARYRDFVLLKAGYERRSHAAQIAQQLISSLSSPAALGGSRQYWQSARA
jgi:hypothetical protein